MSKEEVWTLIEAKMKEIPGGPTGEGWNAQEMTTALQGEIGIGWTVIDVADVMRDYLGVPGGK